MGARIAALIALVTCGVSVAADADSEWRLIGRNAEQQHYAPLKEITDRNVGNLGLLWSAELPTKDGLVGVPLVAEGVIYQSGSQARIYANDLKSGKLLWSFDPQVNPPAGKVIAFWGNRVNRGLALWEDFLYIGTGDCRLIAVDRRKGTKAWETQACDPNHGYTITGAPRVGGGKVFIGNANADTGSNRGYADAYDARSGKRLWRFYTIPGDPAKGFENEAMARASKTWGKEYWKRVGGGSVWDAITYDPELKQVYIGTDGAAPGNPDDRASEGGDELFTTSIIALDAETGRYVWHFQTTPHDGWNYDATMHIMIGELTIRNSRHHVVMEAPKNGFFYVLDAKSGQLLTVNNFVPVTWASGVDLATGRPRVIPSAEWWRFKEPTMVIPTVLGAHNWQPMSYSPITGLVYIPTMEQPMKMSRGTGDGLVGGAEVDFYSALHDPKQFKGGLVAYDPVNAKVIWRHDVGPPQNGGVLSTAGNVVFQGTSSGLLRAYRANDGKPLWEFRSDGGFYAAPIAVQVDGKEVVIIPSGSGTSSSVITYAKMGGVTHGPSRLLAFALGAQATLPPAATLYQEKMLKPVLGKPDSKLVDRGRQVYYASGCDLCHGFEAIGPEGGSVPDLRRSTAVTSNDFAAIVIGGLRAQKGMPSFAGKVQADQLDALRAFIVDQAWTEFERQH